MQTYIRIQLFSSPTIYCAIKDLTIILMTPMSIFPSHVSLQVELLMCLCFQCSQKSYIISIHLTSNLELDFEMCSISMG